MSVNTMEPIFSQHSVIVPEDNVPAHAGSERGKPQQQAGTSIQHQKAPAQQGALSGPPDASLRVNVHLLDSLMNLAGELVLSRNQLLEAVSHNDRRALRASGQRINLVTSELQEAIMLTRMQPIGNIFNKFPRVVRDLTKDLGKEVRLEMDGKEVELDKTIVEGLSDPLTHLVRNAVDHGIETQEVRVKAGKDPTGTIRLKAYHEAGQVNIEIQDEGAGIDPGKIAATAVSRGLISHDQVKAMSDKERIALILLPGLSTAEKVTDLSGRGVGMDVVKTNLDKLGGQVDIESDMGRGTRFKIKLPLTLAIIPSLLVSVNGERFAVPQVNVDELIRVAASQVDERIEKVGDAQVLILRGKLIPIVHLADCMGIQRTFEDPISGERRPDRRVQAAGRRSRKAPLFEDPSRLPEEEKKDGRPDGNERRSGPDRRYHANSDLSIVVVTAGAFQYGLVVEALHDNIEIVVKPLGRHLKHLKQYAGATIMGDGRVALILDVAGLAQVIGLSSLAGSSRAVELGKKAQQEKSQDIHSFLLFRNGPDEQCAVPLDLVERVEQVKASAIEQVGGRRVMRYRGESMPLLALKDVAMVQDLPDQDDLIVIVFNLSGKAIGLLATPPVDTIETRTAMDESTLKQKGIMGSCIIDNRTTLIVDIFDLIESLHPGWFKGRDRRDLKKNNSHAILLAEDSDFFRSQVKRFLEEGGNNVIAAEDGAAAWNLLQEKGDEVKLVVTDVEMPNLDGYGLARNIKGNERFSHLPVIALTSLAGDEDLAKGKAAGFDEYLIKLDKEKLQETVSVFFQHSHERK